MRGSFDHFRAPGAGWVRGHPRMSADILADTGWGSVRGPHRGHGHRVDEALVLVAPHDEVEPPWEEVGRNRVLEVAPACKEAAFDIEQGFEGGRCVVERGVEREEGSWDVRLCSRQGVRGRWRTIEHGPGNVCVRPNREIVRAVRSNTRANTNTRLAWRGSGG